MAFQKNHPLNGWHPTNRPKNREFFVDVSGSRVAFDDVWNQTNDSNQIIRLISAMKGTMKGKSLNFIYPIKYVIPESLKVSLSLSQSERLLL